MRVASEELARAARVSALAMTSRSSSPHIGSSLSVIDILAVLYGGAAEISPAVANDPTRDRVLISKGHASAAVYAVLAHAGFLPLTDLDSYCADGSPLCGHVTSGLLPGIEFSTGSLGHGLPVGAGMALAERRRPQGRRVFVVMSDGECDEGSTWEAALFAAHQELSSLCAIIDRNGLQSFGSTEETLRLESLSEKWKSFGWNVLEIDGHDHLELSNAIRANNPDGASMAGGPPTVIIAKTVKGKGVSFMEDQTGWHYWSATPDQLADAVREVEG